MDLSVAAEIAAALERLEAHPELASSWGDALSDEALLEMLKAWNPEPVVTRRRRPA